MIARELCSRESKSWDYETGKLEVLLGMGGRAAEFITFHIRLHIEKILALSTVKRVTTGETTVIALGYMP